MKISKLRLLSAALAATMVLDMSGTSVLAQEADVNVTESGQTETEVDNADGEAQDEESSEESNPSGENENPDNENEEDTGNDGQEENGSGEENSGEKEDGSSDEAGNDDAEEKDNEEEPEETVSENSVSENDIDKSETEEGDFDMFPGMGENYVLSAAQLADKQELAAHMGEAISDDQEYIDAEGVYELGEVVYLTDTAEEAEQVAKAFGGTVDSYSYGVAVIKLDKRVTVARAVAASADMDTNLPAVWPNYYQYLYEAQDLEETDDEVLDVGESYESYLAATAANDPALKETSSGYQWMHDYIGDTYAWEAGYKGQGIQVAVIDTGIRTSHEDLKVNATAGKNFVDGAEGTEYSQDNATHGTHVAGIIAAEENNGYGGAGIAPDAKVTGFCVFPKNSGAMSSDVMRAVNAAVSGGYDVINMSLGGPMYDAYYAKVINNAYQAGVAVFVAAGNDALNGRAFPAAYPGAISIGAIDKTGTKASFSNYDATVALSFPGVDIYSTVSDSDSSYDFMDGTSMACPAAAGTAAVILSAKLPAISGKSGSAKVDALVSVMKSNAIKCTSAQMGAGTTYLPKVLGLTTVDSVPMTPVITINQTAVSGTTYRSETVTATVKTQIPVGSKQKVYYSVNGKKPAYKNGVVTNGTELPMTASGNINYTGTVNLTGAKKVTLNVMAVNTLTGKISKIATKAVTLAPIPSKVTITQANGITQIAAGKKLALKAEVGPSYAVSTKVQWSVDEKAKENGIKVANGNVTTTAKTAAGTYKVTATAVGSDGKTFKDGKSATYTFTVLASGYVDKIVITPKTATLDLVKTKTIDLADTGRLSVTLKGGTAGNASDVVWSSSNTKIATVSAQGVVTAKAAGKATITAVANDGGGKKATCAITVTSPVTKITISGPTKVAAAKAITLKADIAPATATNKKIKWSVTGNNVSVNNGKVSAKKGASGVCTVKAEALDGSGVSATYDVTIAEGAIKTITLPKTEILFTTAGNTGAPTKKTLTATITGDAGADLTAVTYSSSAANIVAVNQKGEITAKSAGKATITCMAADGSGKKASCTVTVNVPMSHLSITPINGNEGVVARGKSIQLAAKYGSNFGEPTNKNVVWKSSSPYVTVNKGKVSVNAKASLGNVTITAEAADGSGVRTSYDIRIRNAYQKITIEFDGSSNETDTDHSYGFVVIGWDKFGNGYYINTFDTKITGEKDPNAGCYKGIYTTSREPKNVYYYLTPIPGKITHPADVELKPWPTLEGNTKKDWDKFKKENNECIKQRKKYSEKMTIQVTMQDGSNLKASKTVWVMRGPNGLEGSMW